MEIQFVVLPATFEFVQEYKRWKGTSSPVMDFENRQLNESVSHWEIDVFSPFTRIAIVEQTRSLLGIRWKTAEGTRFTTDELNELLRTGTIRKI